MLLAAVRTHSPSTRLVGYQHASLTPKHLNFVFEPGEASYTPLPDRVVTMGDVTRSFMESYGRFPSRLLATGCALRRASGSSVAPKAQPVRVERLLVTLATDFKEYVGVFRFLEKALPALTGVTVRLRPHPVFPLEEAEKRWGPFGFKYEADSAPLAESLEWADVVIYASSTLGLDAVSMGIPAVYIDWGDYLAVDPIASLTQLKWSISRPEELSDVLEAIKAMPPSQFSALQKDAREYAAAYSVPVTDRGVRAFVTPPMVRTEVIQRLAIL
jgi:hypothetical protein